MNFFGRRRNKDELTERPDNNANRESMLKKLEEKRLKGDCTEQQYKKYRKLINEKKTDAQHKTDLQKLALILGLPSAGAGVIAVNAAVVDTFGGEITGTISGGAIESVQGDTFQVEQTRVAHEGSTTNAQGFRVEQNVAAYEDSSTNADGFRVEQSSAAPEDSSVNDQGFRVEQTYAEAVEENNQNGSGNSDFGQYADDDCD